MKATLYVDGGCSGNSQKDMSIRDMVSVVTDEFGTVLSEQTARGGSNNIAELIAVRDALQWCAGNGVDDVEVISDSMNTLYWVNGSWEKGSRYKVGRNINDRDRVLTLLEEIRVLRNKPIVLTMRWVGRDDNLAGHHIEQSYGL